MQNMILGDSTAVEVPDSLDARVEHDGTLVATPRGVDHPELRLSVLTLHRSDMPVKGAGIQFVTEKAQGLRVPLHTDGAASWYTSTEVPSDAPPGSEAQSWIVGMGHHVLIASLALAEGEADATGAAVIRECVVQIIRSFMSTEAA